MSTTTTSITLLSLLLNFSVAAEPLHFRAIKGDKELVILGSIHMGNSEMYPLPNEITSFLKNSDAVITEVILTDETPILDIETKSTNEVLNEKQKAQLAEVNIQLGFHPKAFLTSPAWQTALTLQISQFAKMGFSQELGIDTYITEKAVKLNKKILGLESIEYQLGLFTEDPNVSQLLLVDTVENWQENVRVSECLVKSWLAGNTQQLTEISTQSAIGEELSDQFIYQRNHNWSEKLNSNKFIPDGKYLVVVGALHLIGKENLMDLLSEKGFEVTQLSKEAPVNCI